MIAFSTPSPAMSTGSPTPVAAGRASTTGRSSCWRRRVWGATAITTNSRTWPRTTGSCGGYGDRRLEQRRGRGGQDEIRLAADPRQRDPAAARDDRADQRGHRPRGTPLGADRRGNRPRRLLRGGDRRPLPHRQQPPPRRLAQNPRPGGDARRGFGLVGWRQHQHLYRKARKLSRAIERIAARKGNDYRVRLQEPFITHYSVLPRNESDRDAAVRATRKAQRRHRGCIRRASLDRGFHSPENQKELARPVAHPCLPMPGVHQSRQQERTASVEFRAARQSHPGIESAIGALQSDNGLERCRDRTERGFARYIGLGVLGRNLHVLGKMLIARQSPDCQAVEDQSRSRRRDRLNHPGPRPPGMRFRDAYRSLPLGVSPYCPLAVISDAMIRAGRPIPSLPTPPWPFAPESSPLSRPPLGCGNPKRYDFSDRHWARATVGQASHA